MTPKAEGLSELLCISTVSMLVDLVMRPLLVGPVPSIPEKLACLRCVEAPLDSG